MFEPYHRSSHKGTVCSDASDDFVSQLLCEADALPETVSAGFWTGPWVPQYDYSVKENISNYSFIKQRLSEYMLCQTAISKSHLHI